MKKPNIKVREHDFTKLDEFLEIAVDHINNAVVPPMLWIGIDPGTTGAIAMLVGAEGDRGTAAVVLDMPIQFIPTKKMRAPTKKEKQELRAEGKVIPKKITVHGKGMVYDYKAIHTIFRRLNVVIASHIVHVVVEKAQVRNRGNAYAKKNPNSRLALFGDTPLTAYKTGFSFGMWLLYLTGRGYAKDRPLCTPPPATWKKAMQLGPDKNKARAAAIKLFPFLKGDLARVKDHNRAEALLLAAYLRRHPTPTIEDESEE